jgi:hypothetical protein
MNRIRTEQLAQDLLVQARFRNAILWEKMGGRTAAEVSREIGMEQSAFGGLLNLKRSPFLKDGSYSSHAQKIANHFTMLPEDLFPASLYALTLRLPWSARIPARRCCSP